MAKTLTLVFLVDFVILPSLISLCGQVDRVRLLLVLACVGNREAERRSEGIQDTPTTLGSGANVWLVDELSPAVSQLRMLDGNKRGGRQNGNDTHHDTKTRLNYHTRSNANPQDRVVCRSVITAVLCRPNNFYAGQCFLL